MELRENLKAYILQKYPKLRELMHCVREFREDVYKRQSLSWNFVSPCIAEKDSHGQLSSTLHFTTP